MKSKCQHNRFEICGDDVCCSKCKQVFSLDYINRRLAKPLKQIRPLLENADLSFTTWADGDRHGKLVELIEELKKILNIG